jgi:hypothetical protein
MDGFPLIRMCGRDTRRFKRIRKFRKIRTQPLCDEYAPWVPYLSFEEEDCAYHSFA